MSDGSVFEVRGSDAREAFKRAQKQYGIGRFVSKLTCYDYGDTYYKDGKFLDPSEARAALIKDADTAHILSESFPAPRLNRKRGVHINEAYCNSEIKKDEDGEAFIVTLSDKVTKNVIRKFRVTLSIDEILEEKPRTHKFKDRVCIYCGQSLFDVDDPNGVCDG